MTGVQTCALPISALFQYNQKTSEYSTTEKFEFYKELLDFFAKYPLHSKQISGSVNSEEVWVEEFQDSKSNKAWIAFCPFLFKADTQSDEAGKATAYEKSIECPQDTTINGKLVTVGFEPMFIEEN